jgi:hypothetical protein
MADILTNSSAYQGTVQLGTVIVDPIYDPRGGMSLNASNQLEGTFWITKNGVHHKTDLGNASYVVRDKNGTAVAGLTQSGITPDVNGYYHTTPVSAALIYDLAHYVVELVIPVNSSGKEGVIFIYTGE